MKTRVVTLMTLLLLIGGGVLSACDGPGSAGKTEGPHMIYFYAKW